MVSLDIIQAFSKQVVAEFHPKSIWLFGSYAYGVPTDDSDVDFLIVMDTVLHPARQASIIRVKLRPTFPVDLVVHSPQEIQERLSQGDTFLRSIFTYGRRLFES